MELDARQAAPTAFGGVAYSGGVVATGLGDIAIDLGSLMVPSQIAVLRSHNADQIVGRAQLHNNGSSLTVSSGVFSAVTDAAREVAALMAEGQSWALSVGVQGSYEKADRARPMHLNGREQRLDFVLRKPRLLEISFVPAGADPAARATHS